MAMSAAERKQRQLERERQALLPLSDSSYRYLATPFCEHLQDDPNWSDVELAFDLMGYAPPDYSDDLGPEHFANDVAFGSDEDRVEAFKGSEKSIGRAEVMVDLLFDAAMELARIVNLYKIKELQKRLKELENAELSDPESRKAALQQSAHINRILEELSKSQRFTAPKWRIKGI